MLTEKSFDAGEIVINFAEGDAVGPPLVMLHGGTSAGRLLRSFFHHSNRDGISMLVICVGMASRGGPSQAIGSLISCPTLLLLLNDSSGSQRYYWGTHWAPR